MQSYRITRTTMGRAALIASSLIIGASGAIAADVAKQLATAEEHAGYAADAKNLKMVHAHLQHVINCLVGPKGAGFDAAALNPCKGLGDGAIPDTSDAAKKQDLAHAVEQAKEGLGQDDMGAAQKTAVAVGATLKKAM